MRPLSRLTEQPAIKKNGCKDENTAKAPDWPTAETRSSVDVSSHIQQCGAKAEENERVQVTMRPVVEEKPDGAEAD